MRVYCVATLDNKAQIDNLCQCIKIIGATPNVCMGDVNVEYEGSKEKCELLIELFEHYTRHGIYTETENH